MQPWKSVDVFQPTCSSHARTEKSGLVITGLASTWSCEKTNKQTNSLTTDLHKQAEKRGKKVKATHLNEKNILRNILNTFRAREEFMKLDDAHSNVTKANPVIQN